MSSLQPNNETTCRECAATLPTKADRCWLCGQAVQQAPAAVARPPADFERQAAFQFSLSSLMLTISLVAVVLGVFRIAFGLGIALAILVAPAFLRTCITAALRKARGQAVSPLAKLGVFASTLAAVVGGLIILIAALVAAVSFFCGIVALRTTRPTRFGPRAEQAPGYFLAAVAALGVIALVVATFVAWRGSRRKKRCKGSPAEHSDPRQPPASSKG